MYLAPVQNIRYRIGTGEEGNETFQRCPSPPPSYNTDHRYDIAPPEYCDALQDVLLDSGNGNGETAGMNHAHKHPL